MTAALPFDRRSFLRNTTTLGALTSVVTLGGACTQQVPSRPAGIKALTDEQAHTLNNLIEVVVPGSDTLPSGQSLDLLSQIDRQLQTELDILRSRLGDGLLLLEWAPQFSTALSPFSRLPADARLQVFEGFGTSMFQAKRAIYQGFKSLIVFYYADQPQLWPHLGYDGPLIGRPTQ